MEQEPSRAYGSVSGFSQSISSTEDPDTPDQEDTEITGDDATTKAQRKAAKSNVMAMWNFTMEFIAEGLIGMIYSAITTKWPTGKACLVVVALHKKYVPKDLVSKIEMKCELNAIAMKKTENPA
eukprot:10628933-Ditylum_brightwellii.AAC.1